MATLVVGFDSAWTPTNSGAIVGALRNDNGIYHSLGNPTIASFPEAQQQIVAWQNQHQPKATVILLDQPTIVTNAAGQRPVENIVGSPVSLRYGGVQPANTGRADMFGPNAPVWPFLSAFGGPANPLAPVLLGGGTHVLETYPVLALIALGWTMPDLRETGRLPKYNPKPRSKFVLGDWQYLCNTASGALRPHISQIADWLAAAAQNQHPDKPIQDRVDACLCLLVAIYLVEGQDCLMVGQMASGYMVVPHGANLQNELAARCLATGRVTGEWVRRFVVE